MILDTLDALQALVMFLLAGIVPGTSTIISADHMFNAYIFLAGFTLARVTLAVNRTFYAFQNDDMPQSSNGTMLSAQS